MTDDHLITDDELLAELFPTKADAAAYVETVEMHHVREFAAELAASYAKAMRKLTRASRQKPAERR